MRIGLISDTHGLLDDAVLTHFAACDEIWHAGDIGHADVAARLENAKPLRAVHGNIDGPELRHRYPEHQRFLCEGLSVWITHIGGHPPRYNPAVRALLRQQPPDVFICGHSHMLRVMPDPALKPGFLYLNPGAAGHEGFHAMRTVLRFEVNDRKISTLEVIELGRRGRQ